MTSGEDGGKAEIHSMSMVILTSSRDLVGLGIGARRHLCVFAFEVVVDEVGLGVDFFKFELCGLSD